MPDYKEMYLKMFRASEEALNIIIKAQRECEELYLADPSPEGKIISFSAENKENKGKKESQENKENKGDKGDKD